MKTKTGLLVAMVALLVFAGCGRGGHPGVALPAQPRNTQSASSPPASQIPARQFIETHPGMQPGVDYYEDEIIVGFKLQGFPNAAVLPSGSSFNKGAMLNPRLYENQAIADFAREIAAKHNLNLIPNGEGYIKNVNFCAYKLSPGQNANDVAGKLRMNYPDKVKYVEYNGIVRLAYYPDDPYYLNNSLWGLRKIRTDLAWNVTKGDVNQWIAVIDTGIRTDHEDLVGGWGYIPGTNTDLFRGDETPDDEQGHGTHVCGTVAATGDNGRGVVGVAYNSMLLPIKVFGTGETSDALVATAIEIADSVYAQGCSVINMSLGGSNPSRTSAEACAQAFFDGLVIVASAGNSDHQAPSYPGSYPEVIDVGATDVNDNRTSYSNYGYTVDLVAPGGDGAQADKIFSTYFAASDAYVYMQGTSMASPHVAGVAALIRANTPTLTPLEVRALIEYYGDNVLDQGQWLAAVPLYRLNAYTPLTYTVFGLPTVSITNYNDYDQVSGDITIQVNANASTAVAGVHRYIDGQYYGWVDTAPYDWTFSTQYLVPGWHTITVEVLDTENAHGYDSVILDVTDTGLATPYWTGFDTVPEQDWWWPIDYSDGNSNWQLETNAGNTWWYLGDLNKSGGRGYYADDVDVLMSPSFDLSGMTNPKLYFSGKWDMDIDDEVIIMFPTSDGKEDQVYGSMFQNLDWPSWTAEIVDLSSYASLTGRFEFWTSIADYSSEGAGFWLDNVVVSDSTGPPVIAFRSPTPARNSLVQGTVTLNATAADDNDIVLGSEYKIGASVVKSFPGNPSSFAWNSASVPDGDRTFTALADDELSFYGYDTTGQASRTFYVHNTAPTGVSVAPSSQRIGQPVSVTGSHFGKLVSGQTSVLFSGTSGNVAATISSWTDTSILCTVPSGAVNGPATVQIGVLSGVSASSFTVLPNISGFTFASPPAGTLVDALTYFTLSPQPYADKIQFDIAGHPEISIADDITPTNIRIGLSPTDFALNGSYTLTATAVAPGEQVAVSLDFFVEKLPGDFNGDGVVNQVDLAFLRNHLWATPGDASWIPYLDTNRNGIIEESDASLVGYNFGNT